eukprot:gnl/MRDRNA2_/MRDRNA2_55774_c0_seq1.p1 gnl/MRDRNA2_/MRDRNA2_55774_c0~~gnl/MRDRNA2_/MRDRNA2_55774_c0_seq1.p1  ORF type:complete len:188 (+),score=30.30 gnl/MRDRNA2_/MRDRNA2_55774_c0_seq1:410-973(+)
MGTDWQAPGLGIEMMAADRGLNSIPLPEELLEKGFRVQYHPADAFQLTEALAVAEGPWWNIRWARHRSPLPIDDMEDAHAAALAWLTDYFIVPYTFNGDLGVQGKPQTQDMFPLHIPIDHVIRFHRPCSVDEWLLFHTRTVVSAGARGLSRTEVYDSGGWLVATVTQEALIRSSNAKGSPSKVTAKL